MPRLPISDTGFGPKNMERIYLGKPAFVDGMTPESALGEEEYQIALLAADGLGRSKIANDLNMPMKEVEEYLRYINTTLRTGGSRTPLAGFFPIDPEDPVLTGKYLRQLTPEMRKAMQAISTGKTPDTLEAELSIPASSLRNHPAYLARKWFPERHTHSAVRALRTVNAIRAIYVREFEKNGLDISKFMGKFAIPNLVKFEPFIIDFFDLDREATPEG